MQTVDLFVPQTTMKTSIDMNIEALNDKIMKTKRDKKKNPLKLRKEQNEKKTIFLHIHHLISQSNVIRKRIRCSQIQHR